MYNPGEDDNEIDRLSREAASGYKAPAQPNWDAMSDLLDKAMPEQEKKRRPLFWWLVPAALVAGAFGYYQLKQAQPDSTNTNAVGTASTPVAKANAGTDQAGSVPSDKMEQPKKADHSSAIAQSSIAARSSSVEQVSVPSITPLDARHPQGNLKNKAISNAPDNNPKAINTPTAAISNDALNNNAAGNNKQESTASNENKTVATEPSQKEIKTAEFPEQQPSTAATTLPTVNSQPSTDSSVEKQTVTVKKATPAKAWAIGVVGALDESTIKFKYGYTPGYGVGVLAGYHFNKTFALYSGAVYTQKNYKMAGTDFTAPKGSWASYYKLETVEGYCRMWEVPLLARFYTSQTANKGFFLSTGISSYFMTRENYTYDYHYMGAPATRTMDYATSTTHLFSILHLSAGFESRVGKNIYMQVEPYAKLPLGGLGTGQIELSSFGLNVGLQLRKPVKH